MPSMSMVVGNVFPFLGLIYTMKVSYNLSFVRMEVVSFFYPRETKPKKLDAKPVRSQSRGGFIPSKG